MFRKLLPMPVVALVLASLAAAAPSSEVLTICYGQPIPNGWVVIARTYRDSCGQPDKDFHNALVIQRAN